MTCQSKVYDIPFMIGSKVYDSKIMSYGIIQNSDRDFRF